MRHHEIANSHQRIELALGVGEQRQDLVAANGAQCLFIEFGQILAAEKDMARPPLQTVAEQPNDGANEDGLTGTREADYAENLAGHEIKAHAVEDGRATRGLDSEPTDREYRVLCGRRGGFGLHSLVANKSVQEELKLDDAQKKLDGAEAHLREAIKLKSAGPTAHYYLGLTLIKFRAYDEAQKELELAISNGGENLAQAHKYLGGVYMSTHKNKEAADELEKYLKLEPKAPDAEKIKASIKDLRRQ